MNAFGFNTPTYGTPYAGLQDLLTWFGKEDVDEKDEPSTPGEVYEKEKKDKTIADLVKGVDPSYLKALGNVGGGGGTAFGLPATGTPNIPRILDAVPLEYLIPMLGLSSLGVGKQG